MNSVTALFLYVRVTLGLLFLVAGFSKARDLRAFEMSVSSFRIVSPRLARPVSRLVVAAELAGSGLLLLAIAAWLGGVLIGLLLIAFIIAISVNLRRGHRSLDCRCFGQPTTRIGWGHVAQNVVLLAMAIAVATEARQAAPMMAIGAWSATALTVLPAVYSAVLFLAAQELVSVKAGLLRVLSRGVQSG